MAGALRELVAIFGVKYDPSGAVRADRDLDKLAAHARTAQGGLARVGASGAAAANQTNTAWRRVRDTLAGLGLFFGAQAAARGFGAIVTAASDADETMNVLQESFKGSTQGVLDFARTAADEVGRSEYQLREFAGTIGAIVNPMLSSMGAESNKVAAQVSTDFAKLAVDLSSFFNTTEEDALVALRAGLVGESEPLRRFGVNIVETNLADFAGVKPGALQKMSQTEKTLLRYRFIMEQTAAAQGDAARTGEAFANKSRALMGQVKDVAVQLGRKVLPAITYVVKGLHDFVKAAASTIRSSRIVEAALVAGAAAAVLFGTRAAWAGRAALWAFVKAAIPVLLAIGLFVGLALVIDDVWVAMEGGDSVFGDFLAWVTGVDGATMLWRTHIDELLQAIGELFTGGGDHLDAFVVAWRSGFADILTSAADWLEKMKPILTALSIVIPGAAPAIEFAPDALRAAADALRPENAGTAERTAVRGTAGGRGVNATLAESATFDPATGVRSARRGVGAQSAEGEIVNRRVDAPQYLLRPDAVLRYPGLAAGPELAAPRAPASNVTNNNESSSRTEVNVNFNGPVDRANARGVSREVERGVRQALREERRKVATGVGN